MSHDQGRCGGYGQGMTMECGGGVDHKRCNGERGVGGDIEKVIISFRNQLWRYGLHALQHIIEPINL